MPVNIQTGSRYGRVRAALRYINPFVSGHYWLRTGLSVDDCCRRFADSTRPWRPSDPPSITQYFTTAKYPLRGTMTEAGFRLYLNVSYRQRADETWAQGTFERTPTGTRVIVDIWPSDGRYFWGAIFAAGVSLAVVWTLYLIARTVVERHVSYAATLLFPLVLFLIVGTICLLGMQGSRRQLLAVLCKQLDATVEA